MNTEGRFRAGKSIFPALCGATETVDYRGKAVLAYTLPVADTDWSMAVKEDVAEAIEGGRRI